MLYWPIQIVYIIFKLILNMYLPTNMLASQIFRPNFDPEFIYSLKHFMMKYTLLLIAICCSALTLSASDSKPDHTTVTGKTITIGFNQSINSPVEVVLIDASGYQLLRESLQIQHVDKRKYNLKNLPAGKYYLKVHQGYRMTSRTIIVKNNSAIITKEKVIFKPACSQKDDHWNVNLLLLNKDAEMHLYDAKSDLVYAESYTDQKKVAKSFNLSKLKPGAYRAVFNIDGDVFSETIKLD